MKTQRLLLLVVMTALTSVFPALAQDSSGVRKVGSLAIESFNSINRVAVAGNYAIVVAEKCWVVDISNPERPREISSYEMPGYASCIEVNDNLAYIGLNSDSAALYILSVADPDNLVEVGQYTFGNSITGISLFREYAYISGFENPHDPHSFMGVLDISDQTIPRLVGIYRWTEGAYDIDVTGDYAYVACHSGMRILDMSEPSNPFEIGHMPTPNESHEVEVIDHIAYLSDYEEYEDNISGNLYIVDVSNPNNPESLGSYSSGIGNSDMKVANRIAYMVSGSGLRLYNVTDQENPRRIGYYVTSGSAFGIAVVGRFAYVAESKDLAIYDCSEAIARIPEPIPSFFILYPAFPNPFNSMTTVTFDLPQASPLSVRIYDLSGRQVATLVGGYLKAGQHTTLWNASGAASGSYLVRMEAGTYRRAIPITLIK